MRSYEVQPHRDGWWLLLMFEDCEEVGRGYFEPGDDGYSDALSEGEGFIGELE